MVRRYIYLGLCLVGALLIGLGIYLCNYIPDFDVTILRRLSSQRSTFLTKVAFVCSWAGNYFVAPLTIIAAAVFSIRKEWHYFAEIVLPVILASLSCTLLKAFIMRPRPICFGFEALVDEPYFSFPSGHTTGASVLVLAFLIILWQSAIKVAYKIIYTILGIAFTLLVAWSRLYNAVHFPSDIIGSFGLVIFFSFATLYAIESLRKQN